METQPMTPQQRQKWLSSIKSLDNLNGILDRSKRRMEALSRAAMWFKNQTGAMPSSWSANSDIISLAQSKIAKMDRQVAALNYAYRLVKDGQAGVQESQKYSGDFDIVTNVLPVPADIKAHIFDRDTLGAAFLIPFIPLLIKAGTLIVTAALVYGCVDAVTETLNDNKSLESDIAKAQIDIEKDIAKSPMLLKSWTKYKQQTMNSSNWVTGLKEAGGSIMMFALLAVAGVMLFKYLDKKKGEN